MSRFSKYKSGPGRWGRVVLVRRKCTCRERAGEEDGITASYYCGQSSCYLWNGAVREAGVMGRGCFIEQEEFSNALGKITLVNLNKYYGKLPYLGFKKQW